MHCKFLKLHREKGTNAFWQSNPVNIKILYHFLKLIKRISNKYIRKNTLFCIHQSRSVSTNLLAYEKRRKKLLRPNLNLCVLWTMMRNVKVVILWYYFNHTMTKCCSIFCGIKPKKAVLLHYTKTKHHSPRDPILATFPYLKDKHNL